MLEAIHRRSKNVKSKDKPLKVLIFLSAHADMKNLPNDCTESLLHLVVERGQPKDIENLLKWRC